MCRLLKMSRDASIVGDKNITHGCPMDEDLARRFSDAYSRRTALHREAARLRASVRARTTEQSVLRKAIQMHRTQRREERQRPADQAMMFGTGMHRLSLISLGELPTENLDLFHTEAAIYPVGYMCRKKYRRHSAYRKRTKDKVMYVCSVDREKGPMITADDGEEWSGPHVWSDFIRCTGGETEYRGMDEFFGFANPMLAKKIESLGDTSRFARYVPVDSRPKTN